MADTDLKTSAQNTASNIPEMNVVRVASGDPVSATLGVANNAKAFKAAYKANKGKEPTVIAFGGGQLAPGKSATAEDIAEWEAKRAQDHAAHPTEERFKTSASFGRTYQDEDGNTHYDQAGYRSGPDLTVGEPGLRAAAAWRFAENSGIASVKASDICVGIGGTKGTMKGVFENYFNPPIYEADATHPELFKQTRPADQVIMVSPGWVSNYAMPQHGVEIIEVDSKGRGLLLAHELEQVLAANPKAKGILINDPCNPTGARYTPEQREAVMQVLQKHSAKTNTPKEFMVFMDDPYGLLGSNVEEGAEHPLQRSAAEPELFEAGKISYFQSLSKEYGEPSLRVGYVVSRSEQVRDCVVRYNQNAGGPPSPSVQNKAQLYMLYGELFVAKTREEMREKRQVVMDALQDVAGIDVTHLTDTLYAYIDFSGLQGMMVPAKHTYNNQAIVIDSPANLHKAILEVAGINAVPGSAFYADPDSAMAQKDWHARWCYSGDNAQLETAIGNLKQLVEEKLQPALNEVDKLASDGGQDVMLNP